MSGVVTAPSRDPLGAERFLPPSLVELRGGSYKVPARLVKAGRNVLALRFVAPLGDKAGTIRKPDSLGFATLGVTNLDDHCLVKIDA